MIAFDFVIMAVITLSGNLKCSAWKCSQILTIIQKEGRIVFLPVQMEPAVKKSKSTSHSSGPDQILPCHQEPTVVVEGTAWGQPHLCECPSECKHHWPQAGSPRAPRAAGAVPQPWPLLFLSVPIPEAMAWLRVSFGPRGCHLWAA